MFHQLPSISVYIFVTISSQPTCSANIYTSSYCGTEPLHFAVEDNDNQLPIFIENLSLEQGPYDFNINGKLYPDEYLFNLFDYCCGIYFMSKFDMDIDIPG